MEDIPHAFKSLTLRRSVKFRSLRTHKFTSVEKRWACKALLINCADVDFDLTTWIRAFSKQYNISAKSVVEWFDWFAENEDSE